MLDLHSLRVMSAEFVKIAEEDPQGIVRDSSTGLAATGVGLVGGMGSGALMSKRVRENPKTDIALTGSMIKDLKGEVPVFLTVPKDGKPADEVAYYRPAMKPSAKEMEAFVRVSEADKAELAKKLEQKGSAHLPLSQAHNPALLAHELGHHEIATHPVGKIIQNRLTSTLGRSAPFMGLVSGSLAGTSDDERLRELGVALPVAASVPELLYEGGATYRGIQRMKRLGATSEQVRRGWGTLLPAYGTYAGRAAVGVGGAYAMRGLVTKSRMERERLRQLAEEQEE